MALSQDGRGPADRGFAIDFPLIVITYSGMRSDIANQAAESVRSRCESLTMIGKLLGHTKIQTTARYAHLARDSIKLSAAKVAASIGADILPAGARLDAD